MSGIINKVKDTIAHHKEEKAEKKAEQYDTNENTSSNYGTHDSNLANQANTHNTSTTGPSTTGAGFDDSSRSSNYGPHDTNVGNAVDPRVDSDLDNRGTHNSSSGFGSAGPTTSTGAGYGSTGSTTGAGYGSTGSNFGASNTYDSAKSSNYGPHGSNVANEIDPRVDSDLDNRGTHNASTGYGSSGAGLGSTGPTTTGAGAGYGSNYGTSDTYDSARSSNHGPHDSNVANQVDPRVDSDRDGRAAHHSTSSGHGAGYAATGAAVGAGAGYAGSHHHASTHNPSTGPATSTAGPHSSNLENRADPRVDSDTPNDRYSSSTGPASSTAGPHSSNVANEADPRVDSDRSKAGFVGDNSRFDRDVNKGSLGGGDVIHMSGNKAPTTTQNFEKSQNESVGGSAAGSSYTGHKTVGPHGSDTANKLDPRVDSDLDGSKTIGSQRY